jgi:hypothetical protein
MNKNNIPYFEANGIGYAIKRNRYLQAELDEMKKSVEMSNEEQIAYAKEQDFDARLEKLRNRKLELYDKFLTTFDEEDEKLYLKACNAYDMLIEQATHMESISLKQRQRMIDMGEKLIIKSLQIDKDGKTIRTPEEAKTIWEEFVGECGQVTAIEFIVFTTNYIVGNDEETENPFITQAKAKAEQRANMKKGIVKAK